MSTEDSESGLLLPAAAEYSTQHPPMRNHDGSVMRNERGEVVYRSQFLSTHPLRKDCMERLSSPNGMTLTYVTGDGVIRTMNACFGHGGWSTEITRERQEVCERYNGRWLVGYVATVRVSLQNGASHEDCGTGECVNESKVKAIDTAFKAAVTDAMKRASRHFGERLGNALYVKGSGIHTAPIDNKTALSMLEQSEANDLFGDQKKLALPGDSFMKHSQSSVATAPAANTSPVDRIEHSKSIPGWRTTPMDPKSRKPTPLVYPTGFDRASDVHVTPQDSSTIQPSPGATGRTPSTESFLRTQYSRTSSPDRTTCSPPTSTTRPVSSDGTQPTPHPFPQYTPLDEVTNRLSPPPALKRPAGGPASVDPASEAKRAKPTRNPYDRH